MVRSSMPLELNKNLQPQYSNSFLRPKTKTYRTHDNNVPRRRKFRPRWPSTIPTVVPRPHSNRHHDDRYSISIHLFTLSKYLPRQISSSKCLAYFCTWLIIYLTYRRTITVYTFVFFKEKGIESESE